MKYTMSKFFAGLLLLAGVASCTANYEEINSNPYEPGDLDAYGKGLGSAMNAMAGCVVSPDVNTAQFTDCLLGGTQGGYFADSNDGFTESISNYNPKDDWSRVLLKSDKIIPVLYTNYNKIVSISTSSENPVYEAVASVIKVAAMHRVADTFGPIPYSQIGEGGSITTPYDALDKVYDKFFEELNAAITVLTANQDVVFAPTADYIYSGDVKKWIKFANSLKLRLAIRIASVDETKAREMAESAVANEVGVFTSNADNAAWNYFKTVNNPIYTAVNYNNGGGKTGGDTHASADIICYMNGYEDPRREKYFTENLWGVNYVGLRRGIIIPAAATALKYSGVKIASTDPLYWMNAAEVAFLRAEGAAIFGFNMGGSAGDFYNEGIRLSFAQWGVDNVADYLNVTAAPQTYTDPSGSNSYPVELTDVSVKWDEAASKEVKQERIIIQKWIANWQIGNESWADFRRTGYPKLIPATDAGNKSNGIVSSIRGARRMPYPQDEYVSNTANVTKAVTEYLNGSDNMATDLWWARKN